MEISSHDNPYSFHDLQSYFPTALTMPNVKFEQIDDELIVYVHKTVLQYLEEISYPHDFLFEPVTMITSTELLI